MPKLIFGPGTVDRLGILASAYGPNVLLVTGGRSLERSGDFLRIQKDLQLHCKRVKHYRICGEPSPETVDHAADQFATMDVDVVVAVGGGSAMDGAKAIAAMLKETGSVNDYLEGVGSEKPSGRSVPVIAIPTTSGTGSEATKNAVLSRIGMNGFKKSLRHDNYIPKLAILDPELCVSAKSSITAACGMDALAQLLESYVSSKASALTDALSVSGLRHLIPALPDACEKRAKDVDCRGAVAYGAFLSGVTLAHAGLGVVHGVAGPMGGLVAIPHGVACANLLPSAMAATVDNLAAKGSGTDNIAIDKLARIGRIFGASYKNRMDCCRHLVDCLYRWMEKLKIPLLRSFGLSAEHVDRLVELSSNKNNPSTLSTGQIRSMIMDRY